MITDIVVVDPVADSSFIFVVAGVAIVSIAVIAYILLKKFKKK